MSSLEEHLLASPDRGCLSQELLRCVFKVKLSEAPPTMPWALSSAHAEDHSRGPPKEPALAGILGPFLWLPPCMGY